MKAHIRIADLDETVGTIELRTGRVVTVRAIDGGGFQLHAEFERTQEPALLYQIAQRCMPEATEAEVLAFTPEQVGAVIAMALGKAAEVLTELERRQKERAAQAGSTPRGNGDGPRPASRRSTSATRSRR